MTTPPDSGDHGRRAWFAGLRQLMRTPDMMVVVLSAFIAGMSVSMFRPLIAPYATTLGAGPFVASLTVAAASAPGLLLAVPAGSFAGRFGERWVLIVSGACMTFAGVLIATLHQLPALTIGMLLVGIGVVTNGVANQGLATAPVASGDVDTRRVAAFGIFIMVGQMAGPLVGGVLSDLGGYPAAFWAVAALGFLSIGLGLRTTPIETTPPVTQGDADDGSSPAQESGALRRAKTVLRTPMVPTAIMLSVLGTLLRILLLAFLPLHLDQNGWSPSAIGVLLSGSAGFGLIFRFAFPIIERRLSSSMLFGASLWISAVGLTTAVVVDSVPVIVVSTAITTASLGMINPTSLTLISRLVADSYRRMALGVRITARNGMQMAGPVMFGAVAGVIGVRMAMVAVATVAGIAGSAGASASRGRVAPRPRPSGDVS